MPRQCTRGSQLCAHTERSVLTVISRPWAKSDINPLGDNFCLPSMQKISKGGGTSDREDEQVLGGGHRVDECQCPSFERNMI